jgi:hypothetical protein
MPVLDTDARTHRTVIFYDNYSRTARDLAVGARRYCLRPSGALGFCPTRTPAAALDARKAPVS